MAEEANEAIGGGARSRLRQGLAGLFVLAALGLGWGGGLLVSLGGSPFYVVAAVLLGLSGVLLWRGNSWGLWTFGALLVIVIAWTLWESGLDPWAMLPRISLFYLFALALLLPAARRGLTGGPRSLLRHARRAGLVLAAVAVAAPIAALLLGSNAQFSPGFRPSVRTTAHGAGEDWPFFGGDAGGSRFSALNEITPANAGQLKIAWTYS